MVHYSALMAILLETDSRKRISLAKLGIDEASYFLAEQRADGTILLVPAEVRPKVLETVERAIPDWEAAAAETEMPQPSSEWESIKRKALGD